MGNDEVFAVNATILHKGSIHLMNIPHTPAGIAIAEEFFHVYAKGEGEWYLGLKRDVVESTERAIAYSIVLSVKEIARWITKERAGDTETEKRIYDDVWRLTWVW